MKKADYSIATPEERERVIEILQRNVNMMIEEKRTQRPAELREIVSKLCAGIRDGAVFTGRDFEILVQLFQKKSVIG